MKTIRLTHNNRSLNLTAHEAVTLHKALEKAMATAGIDPATYATVQRPNAVENFSLQEGPKLTDC